MEESTDFSTFLDMLAQKSCLTCCVFSVIKVRLMEGGLRGHPESTCAQKRQFPPPFPLVRICKLMADKFSNLDVK